LDWLELETDQEKQDPARLPKNPVDRSIRELEEAWGVRHRTDGVVTYDENVQMAGDFRLGENNLDLDAARYARSMEVDPAEKHRFTASDLKVVVAEAMRRSAAGYPIREVLLHTARLLEDEAYRVKESMQALVSEHGLAGNVYVRASAYPGCHNGEWTEHVNKHAKSARYVMAAEKCADCSHNRQGSCALLQRRLVSSVPWEEARDVYLPRFLAEGVKVASKGDPKEALRKAFQSKAVKKSPDTYFPSENSSGEERLDAKLKSARDQQAFVGIQDVKLRQQARRRDKLAAYLGKLKAAGLLTAKEAKTLLREGGEMEDIKSTVTALIARKDIKSGSHDTGERATYIGQPKEVVRKLTAHEKDIHKIAKKAGVRPAEVNGMIRWVREELNAGWMGRELDGLLRARFAKPLLKAASGMIQNLRDQHEGLAGQLYIDAATYGDKRGVKGCEEGALKHRTNDIPYVLRMAACDSCVHCNQHEKCNKYGKELVSLEDFNSKDLRSYQQESIRMADAPDAEKTASIFAPVEDPASEWGLRNDNLENFSYYGEEEDPDEIGDLGSIAFSGMDLPEEWG